MKVIKDLIKETYVFLKISLLELKINGVATTLITLIIPLGIMGMVYFVGGFATPELGIQMFAGNLTLVINQSCIVGLASSLLYLKLLGGFEQYSVFPIRRSSLIIANVLYRMILLIPFLIILYLISVYLFEIDLNIHPLFLLIILLTAITLSAIGTLLGICSKNYIKSQSLINIIMFCVMFGAPLFYSVKVLPRPIQIFQFCLPFVYIVDALKKVIAFNGYSTRLWLDIIVLFFFSVISLTISSFFYKWKAVE